MASSGTYTFAPTNADITLNAFSRLGIRGPALLQEHMLQARLEANLALSTWANNGVNLWSLEEVILPTVAGTATYTLPDSTVNIFEVFIRTGSGVDIYDTIIMPISRDDYAQQPYKGLQGQPTTFWFNKQITPQLTLWKTPDAVYSLHYWRMRQLQDVALGSAQTPDLPDRFFDAFVAELAARLAIHFAPALEDKRRQQADVAWQKAAGEDVENVNMYITPGIAGYFP
jgi:hypothetical protein